MTQGEVISFYLRMYQITNNQALLDTALSAYDFLKIEYKDGGTRRYDENGYLGLEEYPSVSPSYVLNGFIYALFGLYDLARVSKNEEVKSDVENSIESLKNNISKYDVGYWSVYDRQKQELVKVYYQKNVHIPQMEALYQLTNLDVFKHYKNKWEKNLNPINILFVNLMYRIRPRIRKLLAN